MNKPLIQIFPKVQFCIKCKKAKQKKDFEKYSKICKKCSNKKGENI